MVAFWDSSGDGDVRPIDRSRMPRSSLEPVLAKVGFTHPPTYRMKPSNVSCQSRLCGNIFGNWRQDVAATAAAKRVQVGDLERGCEGGPPLGSHLRHQSLGTKDLDYPPQVVGQYLQTHLGSHSR